MKRLQIFLTEGTAVSLARRGETESEAGRTALERYMFLMETERTRLREIFRPQELALLADVFNGTLFLPAMRGMIQFGIADVEDHYYEKWMVRKYSFLKKIEVLEPLGEVVLADAIEQFWLKVSRGYEADARQLLGKDAPPCEN
jgi:hypothetical protein